MQYHNIERLAATIGDAADALRAWPYAPEWRLQVTSQEGVDRALGVEQLGELVIGDPIDPTDDWIDVDLRKAARPVRLVVRGHQRVRVFGHGHVEAHEYAWVQVYDRVVALGFDEANVDAFDDSIVVLTELSSGAQFGASTVISYAGE